jgi:hypothetical protein
VYVTAAGNTGSEGWQADFSPVTATVGGVTGTFQNMGNGSPLQSFTLGTGQSFSMGFRWSEPYLEGGDPGANFQVHADFAVYLVNAQTGQLLATFDDDNANTGQAYEHVNFTNDASFGTTQLALAFQLKSGPAPVRVGWVQDDGPNLQAQGEGNSTLYGQTLAPGAITVGATPASNPTQVESYSAQGGNLALFSDDQGNVLSTPLIVNKPDVVGPDAVHTSFFGDSDGNGGHIFSGTSAAAPHVAGAAALLMQQMRSAGPSDIASTLRSTAQDLPPTGFDAASGSGLVQLTPPAPTPTPQPAPAPVPAPVYNMDGLEPNNTSNTASNMGMVGAAGMQVNGLTIATTDSGPDYDWYRFTAGKTGAAVASIDNTNLELHLFVATGGGLTEALEGIPVAAGQTFYVEVKGIDVTPFFATQGVYNLSVMVV